MFDYRRNQKSENQNDSFDKLKNLSAIALVGTAGYSYMRRTSKIIETVERANQELLNREKAKLEDLSPLITEQKITDIINQSNRTSDEIMSAGIAKDYSPWDIEDPDIIPDTEYSTYTEPDPHDEKKILREFIGDSSLTDAQLAEQLSIETATYSKARENLEKKYPGFQGLLQQEGIDINVKSVKQSSGYAKTFDIILENTKTKKITKVSIPNYTNGYIREGFREWIHTPGATLSKDGSKIIMPRFDRSFFSKFVPNLEKIANHPDRLKKDPVLIVKDYIEKATDQLFQQQGESLTSNSILGVSGYRFTIVDPLDSMSQASFNREKRADALQWIKSFEGKPVYLLTGQIDQGDTDGHLFNTKKKASMSGVSETSYTKNVKFSTAPVLGMGMGFDVHKQSTFRQNVMKGWGVVKSREQWSTQLGMVSATLLDEIDKEFTEDYVGRMSSVGFYFAQEKNIFDGAAVYVNQHVDGRPLSMDFIGRQQDKHEVKLIIADGDSKKIYGISNNLFKRYQAKEEIRVRKDEIIGIDPINNKPIRANKSGIITHMAQDGHNLKITISSDKHLTIGDKILQTKEVIEHVTDNKSLSGFFLQGEDQEIAEHLSKADGKLGIEFLLNGSSIKRFMNGGVGVGFINKVLSDVIELKKQEYDKLTSPSDKAQFKIKMKRFAEDFITYQLGSEARSAISAIHIDDKMQIGLELNRGIDPNSEVFYKALNLETLIKHSEQTKNWTPFIKRMNEIEKFINTHDSVQGIKYNVISYAKTLKNAMTENPRHVSAFIMSGSEGSAGRLVHANLKLLLASHSVSNINVAKTAGLRWNSRGFIGGAKLPAEMRRNFVSMGMKGLTSYADYLMDHRMNYILDKTKTEDIFVLDSKKISRSGNNITIGDRKINVKTTEFMTNSSDDFLGQMQTEIHVGEELRLFHSIQMAQNGLHNIQGLSDTLIDKLVNKELLSMDDITAIGKAGIGGNSVNLIGKQLLEKIAKEVNNRDPQNKGVYMKLPFEINFSDQVKGDLVSLINFDGEDSFAIQAARYLDKDGTPAGTHVKQNFYTLGGMHAEYTEYFQKVAKITQEFNNGNISDKKRDALKAQLEADTKTLFNNVRALTSSKNTGYTQALHNGKAPLSLRGEVKGALNLKLGELGMTTDRMTALFTSDQTKSYKDLTTKIKLVEELVSDRNYIKNGGSLLNKREITGQLNHRDVRKTISKYTKAINSLSHQLPEGNTIVEQLKELSSIMSKGIDEIGKESNVGKRINAVKSIKQDAISRIDAILKEVKSEHVNNSNAKATIDSIVKGKADVFVIGERFPIKGIGAAAHWKIKHYNPDSADTRRYVEKKVKEARSNGISEDNLHYIREQAEATAKRTHDYLYINQADMTGISGDFDKDFISAIVTSFDTIKDIHIRNMSMMGIKQKEAELFLSTDNKAKLFNVPNSKAITDDTIMGYIDRLTVVKPSIGESKDARLYQPANAQSSIILKVLDDAKYLKKSGTVETVELKQGIEKVINTAYGTKTAKEKEILVNTFLKEANRKVSSLYPKGEFGDLSKNLRFITDINYIDSDNDIDRKITDHIKMISPDTEGMSHDELKLHEKASLSSKKTATDYHRSIEEKYLGRFGEMKVDTPTAYKIGSNLNRLAENATFSDKEKLFMYDLADKIAQTTISTKHGTPSYLDFYKKTFKQLESSKYGDNQIIDRLVSGNLSLEMPGFNKELRNYGFIKTIDDEIDFDTFQKYLDEKEKFGNALRQAHEGAIEKQIRSIKSGSKDIKSLQQQYRNHIDSTMNNYTVNGIHAQVNGKSLIESFMYSPDETNKFILMTAEEKTNAQEARSAISKYTKKDWETLTQRMKIAKKATGFSFLDDPYEAARTKLKAELGTENAAWQIENIYRNLQYADTLENVHSSQQSVVRAMASVYKTEAKYRLGNVSHDATILENIHKSQTNSIRRQAFERGTKPTIFYSGSIIDGVTGGKHLPAIETPTGIKSATRGGSAKLAAIGVGFLAGAFIGQSINMLSGKDAILGDSKSQGLGGEYYEHAGIFGKDITGREMEMFLREKPVKLASEWSHWNSDLKYQRGISNIQNSSIERQDTRYTPSYKGVMVR